MGIIKHQQGIGSISAGMGIYGSNSLEISVGKAIGGHLQAQSGIIGM